MFSLTMHIFIWL